MLRKLIFPIASGFIIGKAVSMYRDKQFERKHPLKSLFTTRKSAFRKSA